MPHSLREFLAEIGTITVGILIALSLEAGVEAWHDRELVEQARSNLRRELIDNRSGLATALESERQSVRALARLADYFQVRQAGKDAPEPDLAINIDFTEMRTAAWESTTATQALTHMAYQDVQALALAYSASRTFNGFQQEARRPWMEMAAQLGGDLEGFDDEQRRDAQRTIRLNRTYAATSLATGQDLLKVYDRALARLR